MHLRLHLRRSGGVNRCHLLAERRGNAAKESRGKALAERKPGLIETRVNRATENVNKELERITDPLSYEPLAEFVKEDE